MRKGVTEGQLLKLETFRKSLQLYELCDFFDSIGEITTSPIEAVSLLCRYSTTHETRMRDVVCLFRAERTKERIAEVCRKLERGVA